MSITISIWHLSRDESVYRHCEAASPPYLLIHSPHSFLDLDSCCKSCIRCTATTEPWLVLWALGRTWDRTGGLQVERHTHTNKCVNVTGFFSVAADWQAWPTCIIVGGEKRSPFWNWKPSLNQTWLHKECSNINDNLSEQCFCSVWRLANKTTSSGTETRWGKREEQHNLCSDFSKQCQALVRVLHLVLEKIRLFWKYRPETVSAYWTYVFIRLSIAKLAKKGTVKRKITELNYYEEYRLHFLKQKTEFEQSKMAEIQKSWQLKCN